MAFRVVLVWIALLAFPAFASDKLIQYIEYIGADYSAAVVDGKIVVCVVGEVIVQQVLVVMAGVVLHVV